MSSWLSALDILISCHLYYRYVFLSYLVSRAWMLNSIVSVPDRCLFIYFTYTAHTHFTCTSRDLTRWTRSVYNWTINVKYQYPYNRNHKSIKQGYIGSSKIHKKKKNKKKTWIPEIRGQFESPKPEDKTGCLQKVSILWHTSITPMFPFIVVKIGVSHIEQMQ